LTGEIGNARGSLHRFTNCTRGLTELPTPLRQPRIFLRNTNGLPQTPYSRPLHHFLGDSTNTRGRSTSETWQRTFCADLPRCTKRTVYLLKSCAKLGKTQLQVAPVRVTWLIIG